MQVVNFEKANSIVEQYFPEYEEIPVHLHDGVDKPVTICFSLTPEELDEVAKTGKIYITQLTAVPGALQPILKSCLKPSNL